MRVTFNMAFRNGVYDINRASDAMSQAQRQVSSLKRVAILPDVPTMAESGLPGFETGTWYGIVAPAGTAKSCVTTCGPEPPLVPFLIPIPTSL